MTFTFRDVRKNLKKKGFVEEKGHHIYLHHEHEGRRTGVYTYVSHGKSRETAGHDIEKAMKLQLKLQTTEQVRRLVECPMDGPVFHGYGAPLVVRRLCALVRHLEEQQIRELLDVVAVRHAVVAEDVAVVPELLDDRRSIHCLQHPLLASHHAEQADTGDAELAAHVRYEMRPARSVLLSRGRFLGYDNAVSEAGQSDHVCIRFFVLGSRVA
jgi:hypothetical protein